MGLPSIGGIDTSAQPDRQKALISGDVPGSSLIVVSINELFFITKVLVKMDICRQSAIIILRFFGGLVGFPFFWGMEFIKPTGSKIKTKLSHDSPAFLSILVLLQESSSFFLLSKSLFDFSSV